MTALLIIGIVLCGLMALLDIAVVLQGLEDEAAAFAFLNLFPLAFAIIVMSIAL